MTTIPQPEDDLKDWARRIVRFLADQQRVVDVNKLPVGTIIAFGSDQVPDGWLVCDGDELLIADYPALGRLLEDIWGTPSTSAYFKLPNLVDKVLVGGEAADTAVAANIELTGSGVTAQVMYLIKS